MDKKSLIGLGLIGAILISWLLITGPSKEELAKQKRIQDSIALAERQKIEKIQQEEQLAQLKADSTKQTKTDSVAVLSDSAQQALLQQNFRDFAKSARGENKIIILENDLFKVSIHAKGGRIGSVELKNQFRADRVTPVTLFNPDSSRQALVFMAYNNTLQINTDSLYFVSNAENVSVSGDQEKTITLRLNTNNPNAYIEYIYGIKGNDYMVNFDIRMVGMQNIISPNTDQLTLKWEMAVPSQELHIEKERQSSTVHWKFTDESPDYINAMKDEEQSISEQPIQWIAFKQQFFSSAIIADNSFMKDGSIIKTESRKQSLDIVKKFWTELGIPYNHNPSEQFGMRFYFGPNHYNTLKSYDIELEKMINIGWTGFNVLNKWLVIPVFNAFKDSTTINYGIIILVLTIIIKVVLFPIAYKTYISSAKMRLLKPELDILNKKFPNQEDAIKKNQEMMALYRKAGASPFSGCIPALIQFPILIALFNFFPASFELRQKAFLWADDLSTYDSVWDFGHVPIINSIYGDHVSLFALLMFLSTLIYTWMNSSMMAPQQNQMPGMKYMMYLMPFIFLSFMNSYSAGLSWYYFLANMITFLQTWLMRKMISDTKLRAEIDAHMKKPQKKSGFQARLEEMARQRQQQAKRK